MALIPNPFKSEANAFRFLLTVGGAIIALTLLVLLLRAIF